MEKKINLEEIWLNAGAKFDKVDGSTYWDIGKAAMMEFGEQLLERASENANMIGTTQHNNNAPDVHEDFVYVVDSNGPDYMYKVDESSIINTIKEVE